MTKTQRWFGVIAAFGIAAASCTAQDDASPPDQQEEISVPAIVLRVATAANAIADRPAAADSVLTAHGFTKTEFDSLLYEIAAEPSWTEAYQDARR